MTMHSKLRLWTVPVILWALAACSQSEPPASTAPAAEPPPPIEFEGKVAVITGTSSGLGKELAAIAIERGMKLVLVDINPGPSEAMAAAVVEAGGEAIFVEVDLADPEQRPQIIERALEAYGTVDFLFNNAGYNYAATLEQMELPDAHRLFEVNYWAYADLAAQVIPIMREQGGGVIMNTASILGTQPGVRTIGHYTASKHAVVGMFATAAREVRRDNIKIHVAAPAGMRTNIVRNSVGPAADPTSDLADKWEDPAIVAGEMFEAIGGSRVVFFPGAQRESARELEY